MKKPNIIIYDELIEPINKAIDELNQLIDNIPDENKNYLVRSIYSYSFAIFECSFSDCLARYLKMFPQKLSFDRVDLRKYKDVIIDNFLSSKLIDLLIEDYLISITYGKTEDFISKFSEILSIKYIDDYYKELNEKKERRNLLLHNNLIINIFKILIAHLIQEVRNLKLVEIICWRQ